MRDSLIDGWSWLCRMRESTEAATVWCEGFCFAWCECVGVMAIGGGGDGARTRMRV